MSHFVVKAETVCQDHFEAFKNAWGPGETAQPVMTWEQFMWRLRRGFVQCRAEEETILNNRA